MKIMKSFQQLMDQILVKQMKDDRRDLFAKLGYKVFKGLYCVIFSLICAFVTKKKWTEFVWGRVSVWFYVCICFSDKLFWLKMTPQNYEEIIEIIHKSYENDVTVELITKLSSLIISNKINVCDLMNTVGQSFTRNHCFGGKYHFCLFFCLFVVVVCDCVESTWKHTVSKITKMRETNQNYVSPNEQHNERG